MIAAIALAAQLTAATPDCTPVPLPPAILKHVHRKAHATKPHAKRKGHTRRKAKRQPPPPVICRPTPPVLDFSVSLPPLDVPVLDDDTPPPFTPADTPPPFTPAEAYADEAYWDDYIAPPSVFGGYAPAPPVAPDNPPHKPPHNPPHKPPHKVPEPGPLGLMALGVLACIVDGRRRAR